MERLHLKRRPAAGPEGYRYLSEYLKNQHGVEVGLPTPSSLPESPEGVIADTVKGIESETDVELLRRKVVRLSNALAETEKERDALRSKLLKLESAVSNLDNVILSDLDDASDKAKKLELLKVVFEENKKLRKDLAGE